MRPPAAPSRRSAVDAVLATAVMGPATWLYIRSAPQDRPFAYAEGVVVVAATIAVVLRRRYPAAMLGLAVAVLFPRLTMAEDMQLVFDFGLAVVVFSAAAVGTVAVSWAAFALSLGMAPLAVACLAYWTDLAMAQVLHFSMLTAAPFLLAWSLGETARWRTRAARSASAAGALTGQHQRFATRLHVCEEVCDTVAHDLAAMTASVRGAVHAFDTSPHAAKAALRSAGTAGNASLGDLRHLVEGLHGTRPAQLALPPGLAQLPDLVRRMRDEGLPVEFVCERPDEEPRQRFQAAVFRIAEELFNAVGTDRPPPVSLRVEFAGREALLRLDLRAHGGGVDLDAVEERARLYGGTCRTHPTEDGGLQVVVRLPA